MKLKSKTRKKLVKITTETQRTQSHTQPDNWTQMNADLQDQYFVFKTPLTPIC